MGGFVNVIMWSRESSRSQRKTAMWRDGQDPKQLHKSSEGSQGSQERRSGLQAGWHLDQAAALLLAESPWLTDG